MLITEIYTKTAHMFREEETEFYSLVRLKDHCLRTPTKKNNQQYFEELKALFSRFILNTLGLEEKINSTQVETNQNLVEVFTTPSFRTQQLGQLPFELQSLCLLIAQQPSNQELVNALKPSQVFKDNFLLFANQPPFACNHAFISCWDEAQDLLCQDQFQAILLCACIAECLAIDGYNPIESTIFHYGIECAYITAYLAKLKNLNGPHLFRIAIMRSISLLLVYRHLNELEALPEQNQLFLSMHDMLPKLDYWLAKDLGLDDPSLAILKCPIVNQAPAFDESKLLQEAEHCHLAILLYMQELISKRECFKLISQHHIDPNILVNRIISTSH